MCIGHLDLISPDLVWLVIAKSAENSLTIDELTVDILAYYRYTARET